MTTQPTREGGSRWWDSPSKRKSLALLYCLAVSLPPWVVAALVYGPGERWWPTTVALFGPLWLLHLPLASGFLVWLALDRRWLAGALLVSSELVLLFALGFSIPLATDPEGDHPALTVMTWNLGGQPLTAPLARRFFDTQGVDLAVFQECPGLPSESDVPALSRHESLGMCLLSKLPLEAVEERDRQDVWQAGGSGAIVRYTLRAPWGQFTVTNVHLETPREGFEAFFDANAGAAIRTLSEKNEQRYVEANLALDWTTRGSALPRLVAGDFNTTPQSDLLRDTWKDFTNCFSAAGFGFGHTKTTRLLGVRIDHLLASPEWACVQAQVGDGFTSDHDPLLAQVVWLGVANTH